MPQSKHQETPDDSVKKRSHDFKREYYENMDAYHLLHKITIINGRLKRLKDPTKRGWAIHDIYYEYLQILERLFINAYSLRRKPIDFPAAIFIDSKNLQSFINDMFLKKTDYSKWFLSTYVLSIHEEVDDQKIKNYENVLMECAKDYLDNYQLLNAYKHGARVSATDGDSHMYIKGVDGKSHRIASGDSHIRYFSKQKDDESGGRVIYEHDLVFNKDRVIDKSLFCVTLLQNIQYVALRRMGVKTKKREKYMYYNYVSEEWKKSFGGFTWKIGRFSVGKVE